jgi:hypothetical protein
MANHNLNYDALVQEALLGVLKKLLTDVARHGLPGQHHFYIAFRTGDEGVSVPKHLKAKYPDEMTIVLQNQFWDLKVFDDHFEVGLSFNQKQEILVVPFAAITGFLDPSVEFGLQFQKKTDQKKLAAAEPVAAKKAGGELPVADKSAKTAEPPKESGEKIVTLDAFRKKK